MRSTESQISETKTLGPQRRSFGAFYRFGVRFFARAKRIPLLWRTIKVLGPFVPVVLLWELAFRIGEYEPFIFPGPSLVLADGIALIRSGELWQHIVASMRTLLVGFGLGAVIGIPLGIAMGRRKGIATFFDPIINLLQAIPGLAWVPLAIVWFGLGYQTQVFIVFTAALFPLLFNTLAGVRGTDPVLIDAALTQGAHTKDVIVHVVVPSALPSLMTGIRLGFGYGFRALVGAEIIVGTAGLGFMIFDARRYLRTATVILGMIVIGAIWVLIDRTLMKPIERITVERWGTLN